MPRIAIFRAGTRPDASGQVVSITPEQLSQTAARYNPSFHEAPLVIGHPNHDAPAWGWVKGLALEGEELVAEVNQLDPTFSEMVSLGRFKKVSAAFYLPESPANPTPGVLSLRHVGFLGAMPPAVKGLSPVAFNEAEEGVVSFADESPTGVIHALKAWMSNKFGQAEADKALPIEKVGWWQPTFSEIDLSASTAVAEPSASPSTPEEKPTTEAPPTTEGDLSMTQADIDALKAENEALKQEKAVQLAEQAKARLDSEKAQHVAYAEGLVNEGKLAPVAKEAAVALLDCAATMASGQSVAFNEGESFTTKVKAFLEAQPQVVTFSEVATKANSQSALLDSVSYSETDDPKRVELDQKVRAHMLEHNVDYATALAAVV